MAAKRKLMGGKFGFPPDLQDGDSDTPSFLHGTPILFHCARAAIRYVVDRVRPATVWLPSYLCPTILSAIDRGQCRVLFYSVNSKLQADIEAIGHQIQPDHLFLVIDYFGFPLEMEKLEIIRSKGAVILRDCSQALFLDIDSDPCNFIVFSPRKFLGVPDGGILHVKNIQFTDSPVLKSPEGEALFQQFRALLTRRDFDINEKNRSWVDYFKVVEKHFSSDYVAMSELSKMLLSHAFSYAQIISRRRANFEILSNQLKEFSLFKILPEEVVPLGFPVVLKNRDRVQKGLFQKEIYPPIHWRIQNYVPAQFQDSHQLSQQILTLPCDQRYTSEDMNFLADQFLFLVKKRLR